MRSRDRGQIVPVVAVLVVFTALVGAVVADAALVAAGRARAQTAADAAALAGAAALFEGEDPQAAAGRLARANGATALSPIEVDDETLSVEVAVVVFVPTLLLGRRETSARARATVDLDQPPSG